MEIAKKNFDSGELLHETAEMCCSKTCVKFGRCYGNQAGRRQLKNNFLCWKLSHFNCQNVFRQDPLEAILVIFGGRALIFFVWKLLEKMKNDTTFVRMRSGDHLGDAKMSKKGTSLRRN